MTRAHDDLAAQVTGRVLGPDDHGFKDATAGFQTAAHREPTVVVVPETDEDVAAAVRWAAAHDLPVAVQGTGHGLATLAGGVLINTCRLTAVGVDAEARTATVEAGATWAQVVEPAAPHGLAPLSGSAPNVCAVSYTLGGGMGHLARKYGYAADHVRSIDVVTADGAIRHVTADSDPDLFWALRGGRDNFGIVTRIEVELMPVERLYGGGLFFDAERAADIVTAWHDWLATVPEELTSSVGVVPFPDVPALPPPLRGKRVVHIRIAYLGDADSGAKLVEPLRQIGPRLMEKVTEIPYSESGSICNDPTDPMPYHGTSAMLRDLDENAIRTLLDAADPTLILELRQLGGALSRPPAVPNSVGHRDAAFALGVLSRITPDNADTVSVAHDELARTLAPWTLGRCLNFTYGTLPAQDVATAYDVLDYQRLAELKANYDPANMFRLNHNIPPAS
jgi:FAD/FMN-containing dehydrogenase